jgi:hypothetical protein
MGRVAKILSNTLANCQAGVAHMCNNSYLGVEIRRIVVQSQAGQIVHKTPSQKNSSHKMAAGVTPDAGCEFKTQY